MEPLVPLLPHLSHYNLLRCPSPGSIGVVRSPPISTLEAAEAIRATVDRMFHLVDSTTAVQGSEITREDG